ncbi:MAG TPA: cytochrome c3 family protein [Longimicrobiales bacterium]|nr:cytochrome c3 family protein [Longimicrobiales bacterium]
MRGIRAGLLLALLVAAPVHAQQVDTTTQAQPGQMQAFPHERHVRLFPLCTGCHVGVPSGDWATFFPDSTTCLRCHDGQRLRRVQYTAPVRERPTNLKFTHPNHIAAAGQQGTSVECTTCHTPKGGSRMDVRLAQVPRCLSCHAHPGTSHYVDAPCATCHVPLANTNFGVARVRDLPVPDDHRSPDFLRNQHGRLAQSETARCSTCHTQERCTSCHVSTGSAPVIARIPQAGPNLDLPSFPAHYFTPASHEKETWLQAHGARAKARGADCSACHTRNDCQACHVQPAPAPVQHMPPRPQTRAPGVMLVRKAPPSHATPGWQEQHGTFASSDGATCQSCHTRRFCEDCHTAPSNRFHPADFVARHASTAYSGRLECQSCHNVAVFCRACHEQVGVGTPTDRPLGPGFHDGKPGWLLQHGQAARQDLETCASCHKQQDCLQCHSETGTLQINPHGPDFDPQRVQKRNAAICAACHIKNPLSGGNP